MRQFFATVLCACLIFLCACGSAPAQSAPDEHPAVEAVVSTPAPEPTPTPTPPPPRNEIILTGGNYTETLCGRPYEDPGFTAYDENSNPANECVTVSSTVNCWKTGEYEQVYSMDGCESVVRTVRVVPASLPKTVPTEKVIYLTFDDGPCEYTHIVLDILKQYDVKATFFVITGNNRYLDLLPRMVEEGHTIAIHGNSHDYNWIYSGEDVFFTEFMKAQEIIHEYTGNYASLCRFPGGSVTASFLAGRVDGGYDTLNKMLNDMGVRYVDWSVQIEDSDSGVEGTFINFKVLVGKAETPIVLQHDTRLYSVYALEHMIPWALDNGYTFAALDASVPEVHFPN